jgi:hypothetical protein
MTGESSPVADLALWGRPAGVGSKTPRRAASLRTRTVYRPCFLLCARRGSAAEQRAYERGEVWREAVRRDFDDIAGVRVELEQAALVRDELAAWCAQVPASKFHEATTRG